jgi:hypothetical protein
MRKMKKAFIEALIISASLVTIIYCSTANGANSTLTTANDESFVVDKVLYAFAGSEVLCSFNSASDHWVKLDLSTAGWADNYSLNYAVNLSIVGATHGVIFSEKQYTNGSFSQTISLNNSRLDYVYEDEFSVTVSKAPFYSTVILNGTIAVTNTAPTSTTMPTETPINTLTQIPKPSLSPSPSFSPTVSPSNSYSPTQQPTLELSQTAAAIVDYSLGWVPYLLIGLAVLCIVLAVYFVKHHMGNRVTQR